MVVAGLPRSIQRSSQAFPRNVPGALCADEYDGYAPRLVQLLRKGGDAEAIAAHLHDVEHRSMDGPLTSPERLNYLGSLIRHWYENSQDSWSDFGPVRR
jgi:hypothetical protein